jgi:hypothetical protein
MDNLFNNIIIISEIMVIFLIIIFQDLEKKREITYKVKLDIGKILRFIGLIYINLINFIFGFFRLKTIGNIVLQSILSFIMLVIFFYDLIYLQGKKDQYIIELQKDASKKLKILDLFEVKETKTEYNEEKKDQLQDVSIVVNDGQKHLYFKTSKGGIELIPKSKMSDAELRYICHIINYNLEAKITDIEIYIFENKEIYKYSEFIDYRCEVKVYKTLCNFFSKEKVKNVITIGLAILLFLFIFLIVLNNYFGFLDDLFNWFNKEI